MHKKQAIFSTKWITVTALLTAMVVALGYVPGIPVLTGKIYWCDFAIFTAAYLTDPVSAMIVGGIGTTFFDLFGINGTAYNAIPSLIIHGLQGLTCGVLFRIFNKLLSGKRSNGREAVAAVLSSLIPAAVVILGYFIKRITWEGKAPEVAVLKMPANVLQEAIGIAVAVGICYGARLKRQLVRAHLLPAYDAVMRKKSAAAESETAEASAEGATGGETYKDVADGNIKIPANGGEANGDVPAQDGGRENNADENNKNNNKSDEDE